MRPMLVLIGFVIGLILWATEKKATGTTRTGHIFGGRIMHIAGQENAHSIATEGSPVKAADRTLHSLQGMRPRQMGILWRERMITGCKPCGVGRRSVKAGRQFWLAYC